MSSRSDKPHSEAVVAQVDRLCNYERFKNAPKLKRLLRFVVAQWLLDVPPKMTERFIGDSLAAHEDAEKLTFDKDTGVPGYPTTKSNLRHVRNRLTSYYLEPVHSLDLVIIKMEKGSYMPIIEFNPARIAAPDLDETSIRLVLRTKTALDTRTYAGAFRAYSYFFQFLEKDTQHYLKLANIAFIPFATVPITSHMAKIMMPLAEQFIGFTRDTGFNPWECTFVEGCIKAARDHEWTAALNKFNAARDISQRESMFYWWHTALLASTGDIEEGISILKKAVSHYCRTNLATRADLALLQIMAERYEDAEETLSSTFDFVSASNPLVACYFTILYEAQNRLVDAVGASRAWFERWKTVPASAEFSSSVYQSADFDGLLGGMLALICGRGLDPDKAKTIVDILLSRKARRRSQSSFEIGIALIGVGEFPSSVDWLRRAAFEEHEPMAMWFHIFPPLRHLRESPEFQILLRDLNLPAYRSTESNTLS